MHTPISLLYTLSQSWTIFFSVIALNFSTYNAFKVTNNAKNIIYAEYGKACSTSKIGQLQESSLSIFIYLTCTCDALLQASTNCIN